MNTIDILGDDEALKQVIERTITEFEDNELLAIEDSAFRGCNNLTSVNFPNVTDLGDYAFYYCSSLTSVNFPNVTWVGNDTFPRCSSLTSVDFPNVTGLGARAFNYCSGLTSVNFPKLTRTSNAFRSCSSLTSVNFPKVTNVESYAFVDCYSLTSAKFPLVTSISNNVFDSCSKLKTLYIGIESDKVCTLSNTNAIPSNVTDIYVPAALVDSYKTATNWSSFADKIKWYEQPVACQSLTITADDVAGYQTSTTIHYEATCTYSIEGVMQSGTMVFKGDVTSNTFGKNPSSDSSRSVEVSYTFLGKTATTTITQSKYVGDPLGGTIFYIDDTADGAYEFYDAEGNVISSVAVGDAPAMYKVLTPGTKDKYYVCNTTLYPKSRWTYYKNGSYVYNSLGTGTAIGTGKTNTATVMSADNGAYITSDSNGYPTIWYQLQQTRSVTGCNDWFVPSKDEMEAVRTSRIIAFSGKYIWSSSEYSSSNAWYWYNSYWYDDYKNANYSVFFVRAF